MQLFVFLFEIIGTVSFALSGAMTALKKDMDIFGICALGVTTATGGGIIRDLILGITPPATFVDPKYVAVAICVSIFAFFPFVRRFFRNNQRLYDMVFMLSDAAGLGIFTVCGAKVAMEAGFAGNTFLTIFVAVITGVGGGVMRDIFAGDRPAIFVRHIYACAAIIGAVVFCLFSTFADMNVSMVAGFMVTLVIRVCSAHFRWSLPKARDVD